MEVLQKVLTIVLVIVSVFALILDIGIFISWAKAKEKAIVGNWMTSGLALVIALANLIIFPSVTSAMLLAAVVLWIPISCLTCLSPEGIRIPVFINGGISPVGNHSYEYKKNSLGMETLYIYNKNSKKASAQNLGIKKMKTVKMLADWYGKHGYENPLTK